MSAHRRTFKDPAIQRTYDAFRDCPPDIRGGIGNAYWKRRQHPQGKCGFLRNSVSYGAWAAGVDAARDADQNRDTGSSGE